MYAMKEVRRAIRRDNDLRHVLVRSTDKDVILLDMAGDGSADMAILDTTGDGNADTIALDTDNNGFFDTMLTDTDGNDIPDTILIGDLTRGVIDEVVSGVDVEDAITALAEEIMTAVVGAAIAASAVDALAEAAYMHLIEVAEAADKADKAAARELRKAQFEQKRIENADARRERVDTLKAKISKTLNKKDAK